MNNGAMMGWIFGIAGALIGLAGGAIGTYFSIKNTNGPRERAFMVKSAVVCWLGGFVFIALLLLLPNPYRWFLFIPYGVLLPLGITFGNRKQRAIREEEALKESAGDTTGPGRENTISNND